MKEIKCPNCGKAISVDDADFASILSQVKNQAFEAELAARLGEMSQRMALEQKTQAMAREQAYQSELARRDAAIKERENEIGRLRQNEGMIRQEEQVKREQSLTALKVEVERLKAELAKGADQVAMARMEEQSRSKDAMRLKESEVEQLKLRMANEQNAATVRENMIKSDFERQLKQANEMVEYYKDMKIRLSTKMVGESLEQHCSTQFNTTLRPIMPQAYFEKDNDAADGTKGDFVFRDFDDGMEYISIMFEMKNEMDQTATKHRNEDFLAKLDSDRRKKGCEYAVLVSLLEADNELYNNGIVDFSHRYEKMYVIRPQFFIPIITLLVQASRKTVEYKRKLVLAEQQSIDLSNFTSRLEAFKDAYGKNMEAAQKKFNSAIEQIDKSIASLQKVRESLLGSEEALRKAGKRTEELTIKRLTWGSKSLREQLEAGHDDTVQ